MNVVITITTENTWDEQGVQDALDYLVSRLMHYNHGVWSPILKGSYRTESVATLGSPRITTMDWKGIPE